MYTFLMDKDTTEVVEILNHILANMATKDDVNAGFASLRAEMQQEFASIRAEMRDIRNRLDVIEAELKPPRRQPPVVVRERPHPAFSDISGLLSMHSRPQSDSLTRLRLSIERTTLGFPTHPVFEAAIARPTTPRLWRTKKPSTSRTRVRG